MGRFILSTTKYSTTFCSNSKCSTSLFLWWRKLKKQLQRNLLITILSVKFKLTEKQKENLKNVLVVTLKFLFNKFIQNGAVFLYYQLLLLLSILLLFYIILTIQIMELLLMLI